jgi:Tol biopolymer transport system component
VVTAAILCLAVPAQVPDPEAGKPQGPYVGQTPPGTTPVVFAPAFVCKASAAEYGCTFTPDETEFYFSRDGNTRFIALEADGWSKPKAAPWNTKKIDMEPHVTADGARLWFSSNRKLDGVTVGPGIWVMDRVSSGWGAPRYHGPGMYPATSANGDLYYTDLNNGEGDRIVMQPFEGGEYGPVEPLGDGVNGSLPSAHPCISWDGSFVVFDSPRSGSPNDPWHLYVSFRMPDASWSEAARLEETGQATIASLSPDGRYLFFNRDGDIWWVSAEIIEGYRPAGASSGTSPEKVSE